MIDNNTDNGGRAIYDKAYRLSADQISAQANLKRLVEQRSSLRA